MIYLDHNATTPMLPAAWEAMQRVAYGNPSSSHSIGRAARRSLEDARESVAQLLGALPEEVIFTSGATEANNLAIFGQAGEPPGRLAASALEHPCVLEPLKQLANRGWVVDWLPVTTEGRVELGPLPSDTRLLTLMLANHETGVVQAVPDAGKRGVPVHCDAAQAVGKIPVHFQQLGVHTLSASAHKFRGPLGVGLLIVRKGTRLKPMTFGGHQQRGHRPGTESVPLAVGLRVALEHAIGTMTDTSQRVSALRDELWQRLHATASPVVRNGDGERLPGTLNVSFSGCRADLLLMALDLAGVACSTGSACSSGSLLPSGVLAAMGVSESVLRSAMRFSIGETTSAAEIEQAASTIAACVARQREPSSSL